MDERQQILFIYPIAYRCTIKCERREVLGNPGTYSDPSGHGFPLHVRYARIVGRESMFGIKSIDGYWSPARVG